MNNNTNASEAQIATINNVRGYKRYVKRNVKNPILNALRREKYRNDPAYRQRKIESNRKWFAKLKKENPQRYHTLISSSRKRAYYKIPAVQKRIRQTNKEFYRKNVFVPIPDGYMSSAEVQKFLHISRERLRQIRNRLSWKIVGKRKYCYQKEDVITYKSKIFPSGRPKKLSV